MFLISLSACNCENNEILYKVCPIPEYCTVDENNKIITYSQTNFPVFVGQCSLGITKCNEQNEIKACIGHVKPSNEICDGIDNDCNNLVDEGFDNDNDGFTICQNDCNDKDKSINPIAEEICNNIDDNCNGQIDEQVAIQCWTGPTKNIIVDATTRCKLGHKECFNGQWSECLDQVLPEKEMCDGIDNNCNGKIDETSENICGPINSIGACHMGDQICIDGDAICVNAIYPQNEICNNIDDNCDGQIDEFLYRRCSTICGIGVETCQEGNWINCDAQVPTEEVCDQIDNNCDGQIDENCRCNDGSVQNCNQNVIDRNTGLPVNCGIGAQICINGSWDTCYLFSTIDEICNNWDDDCDGQVDNFVKVCGDLPHAGVGQCLTGTSSCTAGQWSECVGSVNPTTEVCDQIDNDCDGLVDENLNPHDKVDLVFAIDDSGSMCPIDDALKQALAQYISEFNNSDHRFALVTFPGDFSNTIPFLVRTSPALTDVNGFIAALSSLNCSSGGDEPSYDIANFLADRNDMIGIGWRSDAYPYIILITDEPAQTWYSAQEQDIANKMSNCLIGSCQLGDRVEDYIITGSTYFSSWDEIVGFDSTRLIEINPADRTRYIDILRNIFTNVCF